MKFKLATEQAYLQLCCTRLNASLQNDLADQKETYLYDEMKWNEETNKMQPLTGVTSTPFKGD